MNLTIPSIKESLVTPILTYAPEVVVTIPFQPVLTPKWQLEQRIKSLLEEVEGYILSQYTMQQALPVFLRLQNQVNNLNYHTQKKSVAIFVSPVFEKTIYLEFEVEDQVMIDQQFKLTDIAFHKKESKQYLLLLLNNEESQLYKGDEHNLQLLKENKSAAKQLVFSFATSGKVKQGINKKASADFLSKIDKGLSLILQTYPYPVFVMGAEKLVQQFKNSTANNHCIGGYTSLQSSKPMQPLLLEHMQPHFEKWQLVNYQLLMRKIEKAHADNKLTWGPDTIFASGNKKGAELVAETGHQYPRRFTDPNARFYNTPYSLNLAFYLTDAADELAEKVLENSGNIHLVHNSTLQHYDHLVLIDR